MPVPAGLRPFAAAAEHNGPDAGRDARGRPDAGRDASQAGGRVIRLGTPERRRRVRRALLASLGPEGRASVFFLHSETGFPEEEILRYALALEREGLVSVEGRPDGNTSRRMVGLTVRGRAGGIPGGTRGGAVAPSGPAPNATGNETGEGGVQ